MIKVRIKVRIRVRVWVRYSGVGLMTVTCFYLCCHTLFFTRKG